MVASIFNLRQRLIAVSLLIACIAVLAVNGNAQTPRAGWASVTGFRNAETRVQRAIRDAAMRSDRQSSGQSNTNGSWLTDAAGGDGARMRSAINRYHAWYWLSPANRIGLDQIKIKMSGDFGGSAYDQTRRSLLVNRIVDQYNQAVRWGPVRLPNIDAEVLSFLGIRKQCLEWAMSTAIGAGGLPRNYHAAGVSDFKAFRPGMGLYRIDRGHAMIIVDIRWDANGYPAEFKVVESNWGSGWQNPLGMVPWQRTIGTRTGLRYDPAVYKTVDYEAH